MRTTLVAGIGAVAALALWSAWPVGETDPATAPPPRADVREPTLVPGAARPSSPATDDAQAERSARVPAHVLHAVESALGRQLAAAGLTERVSPGDRAALRDALIQTRAASLRARRRSRDHAWQAEQSQALVAADRLFRDKLGMGIADFIADAGPAGNVEDLGRRPPS